MAILKMDKIKILGLKRDKAEILAKLQEAGLVELIDPRKENSQAAKTPISGQSEPKSTLSPKQQNTEENLQIILQEIQNNRHKVESGLTILENEFPNNLPDKKSLKLDVDEFRSLRQREQEILDKSAQVINLSNEKNALTADNHLLQKEQSLLKNWLDIDLNLAQHETEKTHYFLGSLPDQSSAELEEMLAASDLQCVLISLKKLETGCLAAVVTMKKDEFEVDHLLKQSGFNPFPLSKSGTPQQIYDKDQKLIEQNLERIDEVETELREIAKEKIDFYLLLDYYAAESDKNQAGGYSENTQQTFYIEGFLPQKKSAAVKDYLNQNFTLNAEIEILPEDAEYPILLKNKPFAGTYQTILEMFGAPNTREIDPTPALAPFTFIFFGMMLSDVGYGLLLTLGCAYLLWKVKIDRDSESGNLVSMLFLSGISATMWGFVFGGFFGDIMTVLSEERLNFPTLWFNPMDDPQKLMIWSMIFGIIHLYAGMAMKIINEVKFGKVSNIIFDIVPWYFLITGLALWLGGGSLPIAAFDITQVGKWLAIFGAAVIFLFTGRAKKNIFSRLLSGIGGLYGAINFLGDILSYTRILALVLATSVIATVVNFLANMVMGGIPGTLGGIVILIVGHLLNLALSALSAYVHSSRLQYVEFFGQFFEGGGEFFRPFKYNTKYVKLENKLNLNR